MSARLGRELPRLLVRLYTEIGNGGFGPSYGLLPLSEAGAQWKTWTGAADDPAYHAWCYPPSFLPIVDYGCAMYYCLDLADPDLTVWLFEPGSFVADDGEQYDEDDLEPTTADEFMSAVFERQKPLAQWLEAWLRDAQQP